MKSSSWMEIDLNTIKNNYRVFQNYVQPAICGAVLKANAYGIGADFVAKALFEDSCRYFFVAYYEEALSVKSFLEKTQQACPTYEQKAGSHQYKLFVLDNTCFTFEEYADLERHQIIPVLNTLQQVIQWNALAKSMDKQLPAVLFIDTGLRRLGLPFEEFSDFQNLDTQYIRWEFFMSHFAASSDGNHPANNIQQERVQKIRSLYPGVPFSLSDTDGILMGPATHHQMVRLGMGLYGLAPYLPGIKPAVKILTRILQIQTVPANCGVGYGWDFVAKLPLKLATLSCGYADGIRPSKMSGLPNFMIHGRCASVVGRVSMDLTAVDVTDIPEAAVGDEVTVLGTSDQLTAWQNNPESSAYQFLTGISPRVKRVYLEHDAIHERTFG